MSGAQLEVADVFRLHGAVYLDTYGHRTSNEQRQAMGNIVNCRTPALGGTCEEMRQMRTQGGLFQLLS